MRAVHECSRLDAFPRANDAHRSHAEPPRRCSSARGTVGAHLTAQDAWEANHRGILLVPMPSATSAIDAVVCITYELRKPTGGAYFSAVNTPHRRTIGSTACGQL